MLDVFRHFAPSESENNLTNLGSLAGKKALYALFGPHSDAGSVEILEGIAAEAEFSIVQATLSSALTDAADAVFPGAAYAEKEGAYTNSRGLVQRIRPAFGPPGDARRDIEIILELSEAMGVDLGLRTAADAADALAEAIPGYSASDDDDNDDRPLSFSETAFAGGPKR